MPSAAAQIPGVTPGNVADLQLSTIRRSSTRVGVPTTTASPIPNTASSSLILPPTQALLPLPRNSPNSNLPSLRRCVYCSTTFSTVWRHGPDGPHTLCVKCRCRYDRRKLLVFANYDKDGAVTRVSLSDFQGAVNSRVTAFPRLPNGKRDFKHPRVEPVVFPRLAPPVIGHQSTPATATTIAHQHGQSAETVALSQPVSTHPAADTAGSTAQDIPPRGSQCCLCCANTTPPHGLWHTGPDGRRTLCLKCHRKYINKQLVLYAIYPTSKLRSRPVRVSVVPFAGSCPVRVRRWPQERDGKTDLLRPVVWRHVWTAEGSAAQRDAASADDAKKCRKRKRELSDRQGAEPSKRRRANAPSGKAQRVPVQTDEETREVVSSEKKSPLPAGLGSKGHGIGKHAANGTGLEELGNQSFSVPQGANSCLKGTRSQQLMRQENLQMVTYIPPTSRKQSDTEVADMMLVGVDPQESSSRSEQYEHSPKCTLKDPRTNDRDSKLSRTRDPGIIEVHSAVAHGVEKGENRNIPDLELARRSEGSSRGSGSKKGSASVDGGENAHNVSDSGIVTKESCDPQVIVQVTELDDTPTFPLPPLVRNTDQWPRNSSGNGVQNRSNPDAHEDGSNQPSPVVADRSAQCMNSEKENRENVQEDELSDDGGSDHEVCRSPILQRKCSNLNQEQGEQVENMEFDDEDEAGRDVEEGAGVEGFAGAEGVAEASVVREERTRRFQSSVISAKERKRRVRHLLAYHTSTYLLTFHKEHNSSKGAVCTWMRASFFEMLAVLGEELTQYSSYDEMLESLSWRLGQTNLDLRWFERPCNPEYLDGARQNYEATWDPAPTDEEWKAETELLAFVSESFKRVLREYTVGERECEVAVCDAVVNMVYSEALQASKWTASPPA